MNRPRSARTFTIALVSCFFTALAAALDHGPAPCGNIATDLMGGFSTIEQLEVRQAPRLTRGQVTTRPSETSVRSRSSLACCPCSMGSAGAASIATTTGNGDRRTSGQPVGRSDPSSTGTVASSRGTLAATIVWDSWFTWDGWLHWSGWSLSNSSIVWDS